MQKLIFLSCLFLGLYSYGQGNTSSAKIKTATSINDVVASNSLLSFKVISYNVYYQPKGDDAVTLTNNGAAFTPEVKKLIQKAKSGDVYYIEEIKVIGPDNLTRKIPGIAFKIE